MTQGDKLQGTKRGHNYGIHQECRVCSSSTTMWCPFSAARVSGVRPNILAVLGLTSFRPNSIFTVPSWPFSAAHESGVWPYTMSGISGLTSFRPNSSFTIPSWPLLAAHERSDWPYVVSGILVLTSSQLNSSFTVPSWRFLAAHQSGVRLELLKLLGLMSSGPRVASLFLYGHSRQPTRAVFARIYLNY